MPNVITALKAEISRIARKEAKLAVAPLRKPTNGARLVLADLKRRVAALEKDSTRLAGLLAQAQQPQAHTEPSSDDKCSVSGKDVRNLRKKLGLSQQAFAKRLGIGSITVFKWEHKPGMLQLRDKTRAALTAALQTGVRDEKAKSKAPQPQPVPQAAEARSSSREGISSKDVRSLRLKLGLSHQEFAKLVGVGHNSTYRWESKPGMLQLRDDTRAALIAARQMGAPEAQAKVAELKAAKKAKPVGKAKK